MQLGFYEYDVRDLDAANVACRKAGIRQPTKLDALADVGEAAWDRLHELRKGVVKDAQRILAALDGSSEGDDESRYTKAHDIQMSALDLIDGEMDRRKALGQTTPLTAEQIGRPCLSDGVASVYGDGSSGAANRSGWTDRSGKEVRVYAPGDALMEGRATGYGVGDIARMMIFGLRNDDGDRDAFQAGRRAGVIVETRRGKRPGGAGMAMVRQAHEMVERGLAEFGDFGDALAVRLHCLEAQHDDIKQAFPRGGFLRYAFG